jgi:hypothetical protein
VSGSSELIAQGVRWSLADKPVLIVEAFADTAPFGDITGATTLRDGTIVVADEQVLRLSYFTGAGKPLVAVGRRGGGPGEFQTLVMMGQCSPDTITVIDPAQDRVTRFSSRGRVVDSRSAKPQGPVSPPDIVGRPPYFLKCGRTGALGFVSWPRQEPPSRPGPHRSTVSLAVAASRASGFVSLGVFAGPERYRFIRSDGPRPFGKTVHMAVSSNRVFVGTADSFFVEVFDHQGKRRGSIRADIALKRFDASKERAAMLERITPVLASKEQKDRARQSVADMQYPEFLPAYARIMTDALDRVWVAESRGAAEADQQWWAFSEGGTLIGGLRTPAAFELYEVSQAHALGKWTNADGVESIRRYQLMRER